MKNPDSWLGSNSSVIVALDVPSREDAVTLAKRLDPGLCWVKVGKELFTAAGPAVVGDLRELGFEVFLDLKFHDIPNTVAGAIRAAANLGVCMVNVHALGGRKMMEAAMEAVSNLSVRPTIIAVTILTSMNSDDLAEVGIPAPFDGSTLQEVLLLAELASDCGIDGVVCSGWEAAPIRNLIGKDFRIVTPGIRLPSGSKDDQARIVTPEMAVFNGANSIVVGRPVTDRSDPLAALQDFVERTSSTQRQRN